MAKVWIGGEAFEFDYSTTPLSEAILIEKEMGCRFAQYVEDRQAGSARAAAMFIRTVWLRNGRDVPLTDLESGAVAVDLNDVRVEDDGEPEPDPKDSPGPDGTPTTGTGT